MEPTVVYQLMLRSGRWEYTADEYRLTVYTDYAEAARALEQIMIDKGCKKKNLLVLKQEDPYFHSILEIRNRHKADYERFDDTPMTGYMVPLTVHRRQT